MYSLYGIARRWNSNLFQVISARTLRHVSFLKTHRYDRASLKILRKPISCDFVLYHDGLACVGSQAQPIAYQRSISYGFKNISDSPSRASSHHADRDGLSRNPEKQPNRSELSIGTSQHETTAGRQSQSLRLRQISVDSCNDYVAVGSDKTRDERKSQHDYNGVIDRENDSQPASDRGKDVHGSQFSKIPDSSLLTEASRIQAQPAASRRKADLSHQNVRKTEAAVLDIGHVRSKFAESIQFRGNTGLRRIVRHYMYDIDPLLRIKSPTETLTKELDRRLLSVFSTPTMQLLHSKGYDVDDIVLCSWILGAKNSRLSIKRYTFVTERRRTGGQNALPRFVLLQILRFRYIDAQSLTLLLDGLAMTVRNGDDVWDKDSGAILLIRLLRHARVTSVSCYDRIVDLAPYVVPFQVPDSSLDDVQRITHFYNRFLSLLALPVAERPFLSVPAQQSAQLKIARWMMHSKHQIVLNREGYRALARVQLLHKKTVEEQQWSSVKAPSWPPWRRDEIGIDSQIDYPGKQSRASKVIKRLLEAGYGPESVEREAQILAGWDVDSSPTVQVRRLTSRRPLSWIKKVFQSQDNVLPEVDHDMWAARVAATRSVREAWLCFFSYMNVTMDRQRQFRVYHEMFHKLLARIQSTDQRTVPSPGDGKEVFQDPPSARDLVYVPREPPSIDELYAQMLQDGIKPTGRLLASLIDNSRTLKRGFELIKDSSLPDVKKDVLLQSEKYPGYFIRNVFSTIPDYLLASYIGLLTRGSLSDGLQLYWPGSKSVEERETSPHVQAKPLLHGMMLLQIWEPSYLPAYHAALEGTCVQAKARHVTAGTAASRRHSYSELWKMAKHTLLLLQKNGLRADLICYRKIVLLLRNSMIRAPSQFSSDLGYFDNAVAIVKSTFVDAVHGHTKDGQFVLPGKPLGVGQQPYWKDVEVLILFLGFDRQFSSIIQLLDWMRKEHDHLECLDNNGYKTSRLMCATRVALEATWSQRKVKGASLDQMQQAKILTEGWNWPEDVDVDEFMGHHQVWFGGMRAALKDERAEEK